MTKMFNVQDIASLKYMFYVALVLTFTNYFELSYYGLNDNQGKHK